MESAGFLAKNTNEVEQISRKATSSCYFGTPPPLPSIPEPGFQKYRTSSRPRRYCQKTQLPDTVKDFPKENPWHSYFRHLKYHITGMARVLKPGGVLLLDEPKYRFTWEELESGIRNVGLDILDVSSFFFKYIHTYLCQKPPNQSIEETA